MKRRPSLLKKIWRKLVSPKPPAAPKQRQPVRRVGSSVETLEGRISPAALINPTTVMYKDLDGDIVTVKFTKSIFTTNLLGVANANSVFKFSDGTNPIANAVTGTSFVAANETPQQLQLIDLTSAPISAGKNLASGTGVTVTVVKGATGNGTADLGYIKATGLPLGAVSINGDLGQIDAGSASFVTGLASLKVKTLGARDPLETQLATGRSLVSNIIGALGSLTVTGDVTTASVLVANGLNGSQQITTLGKIGTVTIGGSLKGRVATEAASDSTGLISADWDIGAVKIGTLATQGIVGGGGKNAGSVQAGGKIASLTVSGDITGSTGVGSGSVHADGILGAVLVKGSLKGGAAKDSGSISATGVAAVTIGGSILGGGDAGSGVISSMKDIGAVKVTGSIDGVGVGATANSIGVAGISAVGKIGTINIIGSLIGGGQASSGFISSGTDMGSVAVAAITGGAGQNSGTITAGGKLLTSGAAGPIGLTVKGDVTAGTGAGSGSVFSGTDSNLIGDMGSVKISGKLVGGAQDNSGTIASGGKIASVTIGPAVLPAVQLAVLQGGVGNFSGSVVSKGAMGAVKITGHVEGGGGIFSGSIASRDLITSTGESAGNLGAVTIAGHLKGGTGADSGQIRADGKLASATTGDLLGDSGARSGSIRAGQGMVANGTGAITIKGVMTGGGGTSETGGVIAEGKIASVLVKGAVTGGTIRAGDDIASITVNSSVTGAQFSARGKAIQSGTTDLAIGKVTITGAITDSKILAGYDTSLVASNPDAQIGAVLVKGNWTASDLVAGVADAGAAGFGIGDVKIAGTDNVKIISQIASIVIGGSISGTAGGTDHFGFTAQKIVAMKVGPTPLPFSVATTQFFEVAAITTNDVTAIEIAV